MLYQKSKPKSTMAPKVCLVSGTQGNCKHLGCAAGGSVALSQAPKATTAGGLMGSHVQKSEHNRYREWSMSTRKQRTTM